MINVLVNRIKKMEAPIVVGLDPMLDYVPEYLLQNAIRERGKPWKLRQRQSGSIIRGSWMPSVTLFPL